MGALAQGPCFGGLCLREALQARACKGGSHSVLCPPVHRAVPLSGRLWGPAVQRCGHPPVPRPDLWRRGHGVPRYAPTKEGVPSLWGEGEHLGGLAVGACALW